MARHILLVMPVVLAVTVTCSVNAQPTDSHNYSKRGIKHMIRDAHTSQQYEELAAYYRSRQWSYRQQAQSEFIELERRMAIDTCLAAKYPRPIDSSRNRYEYFKYEAHQMEARAEHYEELSTKSH